MGYHPAYTLPVIEHKGHSPKWTLSCRDYPLSPRVERLTFSQSREGHWWMKVGRRMTLGRREFIHEGPWQPVPGFGFELPAAARLQRRTAILPPITPAEWGELRGWGPNRRLAA